MSHPNQRTIWYDAQHSESWRTDDSADKWEKVPASLVLLGLEYREKLEVLADVGDDGTIRVWKVLLAESHIPFRISEDDQETMERYVDYVGGKDMADKLLNMWNTRKVPCPRDTDLTILELFRQTAMEAGFHPLQLQAHEAVDHE